MLTPHVDDSPFYLKEGPILGSPSAFAASSTSNPGDLPQRRPFYPNRIELNRTRSSGSNSEEYRSVIDDLTIENKILKRRLKKYERLHCSHLQSEKLFEIRVHSLSPHKKRALERALCQVAASLEDSAEPSSVVEINSPKPQKPSASKKVLKSGNQFPTPVDSAYASNASDMHSNPVSHPTEPSPEQAVASAGSKQENVVAYIKDVPQSLAPSRPSDLSEKAKSKIIVQRIEQLFDGKSTVYRQSEFARQQQDVSNSATLVENRAREARGDRTIAEGTREARILPRGSKIPRESAAGTGLRNHNNGSSASLDSNASSNEKSPDQRPTRPMDLDVHCTQAGAEHMEYIRHLQLASPAKHSNLPSSEESWVYLNLLSSMAQLHIFNVTPEFVRKAITDFSSKLQLSSDGHQVRWRGIAGTVNQSITGGNVSESCDNRSSVDSTEPNNSADDDGVRSSVPALSKGLSQSSSCPNASDFDYKPLFCHENQSGDELYLYDSDEGVATESSGNFAAVSHGFCAPDPNNVAASSGLKSESGPIIFYSKASFFTDLSGTTQTSADEASYCRYIQHPLGVCAESIDVDNSEIGQFTKRPLLKRNAISTESRGSSEAALDFPDLETLSIEPGENDNMEPVDFEASGLGGIQPGDNFVVDVEMQHPRPKKASTYLSPFSHPRANIRKVHHNMPSNSIIAFQGPDSKAVPTSIPTEPQECHILSTKTRALPPSALPPASYVCLPFSSSSSDASSTSDDSDDDDLPSSSGQQPSDTYASMSDELLPHTGHLSASIKSRPALTRSGTNDSDESINMLGSARRHST